MPSQGQLIAKVHILQQAGGGVLVKRDQRVKLINLQDNQIGDLFAFVQDASDEMLSPGHTRSALRRIYPDVGKPLYGNKREPLLLLEEDTVGVNDLLAPACDDDYYRALGETNHPSCRGNLVSTLDEFGVTPENLPDPANLFQTTPVTDLNGYWGVQESPAKPGDHVTMQALKHLLVIVTACSVDRGPSNGGDPSDLMLEVYD